MALKLVSRGGQSVQPQQKAEVPETGLGSIARTLGGAGLKFLQGLESIPAVGVGDLAFREIRKRVLGGTPSEAVFKATGTSPQALQPQSPAEDIAQTVLGNLPLAISFGGASIPGIIGREIASTTAMKGAEALGGGTAIQLLASLLGGGTFNKVTGKIGQKLGTALKYRNPNVSKYLLKGGTPEGLQQLAETAEKKFYNQANKLGDKISTKSSDYREFLKELRDKTIPNDSSLDTNEKEELIRKIKEYLSDFKFSAKASGDRIKASDIVKRQQEVNREWNKGSGPVRHYTKRFNGAMQEALEDIGGKRPKFSEALDKAKGVHKALNYDQTLSEFFFNNPKTLSKITNPFAKALFGGIGGKYAFGGLPGVAVGIAGATVLPKASELLAFLNYPGAREVYFRMVQDAMKNSVPSFIKDSAKLNKIADKYQQSQQKEQTAPGPRKLRLVSRAS